MRFLSLNCFFILSLANAIVDDNKIFTQNTQLDSSYANITSAPIDEEELTWGQIRGGNEQNPITLSAQDLRISAIHHKTGGATGLHITHKSHGRLNGNFSFTSISSDMDAIGLYGDGWLNTSGSLIFESIIGTESYGILIDKDTLSNFDREDKPFLHFKSIQSGGGINNIAGYAERPIFISKRGQPLVSKLEAPCSPCTPIEHKSIYQTEGILKD